jgi:aminopeptidase YwaD
MNRDPYVEKVRHYVHSLCEVTPNRRLGSPGNRAALDFFAQSITPWGFSLDTTPFDCLDFSSEPALLATGDTSFDVFVSPYSLGGDVRSELIVARTISELKDCECSGKILLLLGEICQEQLMPKRFVFYNPDHHKELIALLEQKRPAALVTATSRQPELVGAQYPFPMIEDGDFDIPSVFCRDTVGAEIARQAGKLFQFRTVTKRIPARAWSVIARKNAAAEHKITVCAHIDAYGYSPGACDNATGVAVLLLLAELLQDYRGPHELELIAMNGEDNFSAGGEMDYLRRYGNDLKRILLSINIDAAGHRDGKTLYSFYECDSALRAAADRVLRHHPDMSPGECWYQSDHMVFVQQGVPAMALTSEHVHQLMATITHTAADTPDQIDFAKPVDIALALNELLRSL